MIFPLQYSAMASANDEELSRLATRLRSHLLYRGGMMLGRGGGLGTGGVPPVSLLPRPLPRAAVDGARSIARPLNAVVDALSRGEGAEWVLRTLEAGAARGDDFTGRLCSLARTAAADTWSQPFHLGLHRADYMIELGSSGVHGGDGGSAHSLPAAIDAARAAGASGDWRLCQIEINTVSSGFAVISSRVSAAHRYLLERYIETELTANSGTPHLRPLARALAPYCEAAAVSGQKFDAFASTCVPAATSGSGARAAAAASALPVLQHLPDNHADEVFASAIAAAHAAYGVTRAVVLFIVQPSERNLFDQLGLEAALWEHHGVRVRRATFADLAAHARLGEGAYAGGGSEGRARCLLLPPELCEGASGIDDEEVSVVYYRAGYTPADYKAAGAGAWPTRLLIERSAAIKCPPILYHLAGTKKVQQALAAPGVLERFLPSAPADAAAVRATFAGLWSLDASERDDATAEAIADAVRRPERYVVKPQREGGGNNLFGAAVAEALTGGMSADELAAHILMERVFPAVGDAVLCPAGDGAPTTAPAVCELGVYSAYLSDGSASPPLVDACAGLLLRTKLESTDEGGVSAGFAYLDSPFIV